MRYKMVIQVETFQWDHDSHMALVIEAQLLIRLLEVARHSGGFPSSFKIYAAFGFPQNKILMAS